MKRKFILFMLLLCVTTMWAQGDYEYRYWFDYDDSKGVVTGTSPTPSWDMTIDVSQTTPEMHSLHIQVTDTAGNWGNAVTRYFMKMPLQDEYTLYYQIDNGTSTAIPFTDVATLDIDVSSLSDGIHSISCSIRGIEDYNTTTINRYFYKASVLDSISPIECYIYIDDKLHSTQQMPANGGILDFDIETDSLSAGLHSLSIQALMPNDIVATARKSMFYRVYTNEEIDATRCYCAIDGVVDSTDVHKIKDNMFVFDIDATKLDIGMHTLEVNVVNRYGYINYKDNSIFYRMPTDADLSSVACYYFVDGDSKNTKVCESVDGIFDFDVDVSNIPDGLHTLTYILKGDNPRLQSVQSVLFYKYSGISRYEYWLNDDYENREIVKLDRPQDPFTLITLLEVDAVPVRTEMFHFEESEGIPTVYAMNTITLNFYTDEQMVSHSSDYIDYSVYEVIDSIVDISFLKSHTQTIPAHNKINWYKFYTLQDDTVSLYTNRACRLQLFDAAGNVLYSAEGDSATIGGDVCIPYSANYYVALYEVSDEENDITLNYRHKKIATVQGDANGDGKVSVADIVVIGNYIMGVENEKFVVEAADVNGDGRVSVTDIVKVGNLIMDSTYPTKSLLRKALMNIDAYGLSTLSVDEAMCDDANTRQVNIYVNNDEAFTAMQMDIIMPNGAVVTDAKLSDRATSDHTILLNNKRTDATRIMSYSLSNDNFTGKHGKVVTLTVETDDEFDGGEIVIDNIILAQDNGKEQLVRPINYQMSRPSDVEQLRNEGNITIEVENRDIVITVNSDCVASISYMDGKSINVELTAGRNAIATLGSGVYIVNVKDTVEKVIVK